MWPLRFAKKELTDITDWGKDHSSRNLDGLLTYANRGNLFTIVPCADPEMVLRIRKLVLAAKDYGFWAGFGLVDKRTTENFAVITSEKRHELPFQEMILSLINGMNLSMIVGNGLTFSLSTPTKIGKCKRWSGTSQKLADAYRELRGVRTFSFEGQYDTSVGRSRLEHERRRMKRWKFW